MARRGNAAWRAALVLAGVVPAAFLIVFFAWPAATLVGYGLGGEDGLDVAALGAILARARVWSVVATTVWMAAAGTAGSLVLGVAGAHVLYRLRFPGRGVARALVLAPFVLPTVAVSAGFRALFAETGSLGFLGIDETPAAVIIAMMFFNVSLVTRVVGSAWAHLDPRPEEAALMLGAGPVRVMWDITRPRLTPILTSVGAIVFLYCAAAYSLVLILGGHHVATIETEIYRETTQLFNLRTAAVLSLLQLCVVGVVLVVAARLRARSLASSEVARAVDRPIRRRDIPWVAGVGLVIGGLTIAPLAEIVVRSLTRGGEWTLANYADLGREDASGALACSVVESLGTSLRTAAVAATCALVIGCLIALVLAQRPATSWDRRLMRVFDSFTMLPLGVSAVTVGFGFLLTLSGPPLNLARSGLIVVAAQASVAVPLVVRMTVPVMRGIDPRVREAATMLGSSPLGVLARIDMRFLARPALVAWGFAAAMSLGEFGATSFLVRPLTPTLPVVIYQLSARPGASEQGLAMAASVVLSLVAATVMVAVDGVRRRERRHDEHA
ncbi:iron ABC transporter permease [Nanchangia anserum]|uniref:Iron ABC transporter permease n=2 Tax=Nanchangia anserum TaxID=2692125 RepID=A0A8I0GBJ7_9ACTO|nr:iron ABC transporter permease [Nanchangia anserum]QOX82638.1 iron ABC transporter permease [Nanchangia anserum]